MVVGITDTFTYINRFFSRQTVDKIHKHRKTQQKGEKKSSVNIKKQHD
jgi:hypothetical protein